VVKLPPASATEAPVLPRGRFVILDFTTAHANFATIEEALSHAQVAHGKDSSKSYVVLQIVATVEPKVSSKVTRHRF
jgi:hypothetical protein